MLQKVFRHLFCHPHMLRRTVVAFLGVTVMGACIAVFDQINFGTDPASVLNLGVAGKLGMQLGTYQMLFYLFLLLIVMALREWKYIGIGSIANLVVVGYSKDFFDVVLNAVHPLTEAGMVERVIWLVPTMLIFMVAVSFYMVVELGTGPYDAIPQIISKHCKKLPFAAIRMMYDITALAIGWLLGSTVGVVTIVTGFFLGPIIAAIAKKFRPWFQ